MVENLYHDNDYFYSLDEENNRCVDCGVMNPTYISVNNAVTLCGSCASRHIKLGYNISYIRAMSDEWDNYLTTFILLGGNSKFKKLNNDYGIGSLPLELKYCTKICRFYRLLLKSEVTGTDIPDQVPQEEWTNPINVNNSDYSEFRDYKINANKSTTETIKDKMFGAFSYIGKGVSNTTKKISQKYEETDFKGSFKNGFEKTKEVGGKIYDTTAPVLKSVASKTVSGIGYLFSKVTGKSDNNEGQ